MDKITKDGIEDLIPQPVELLMGLVDSISTKFIFINTRILLNAGLVIHHFSDGKGFEDEYVAIRCNEENKHMQFIDKSNDEIFIDYALEEVSENTEAWCLKFYKQIPDFSEKISNVINEFLNQDRMRSHYDLALFTFIKHKYEELCNDQNMPEYLKDMIKSILYSAESKELLTSLKVEKGDDATMLH